MPVFLTCFFINRSRFAWHSFPPALLLVAVVVVVAVEVEEVLCTWTQLTMTAALTLFLRLKM
jgi:hypothetical protein